MSLKQWAANGWLKSHKTSREEIRNLLSIADRDITDASEKISPDGSLSHSYNAVLNLARILLAAEGYRSERNLQHYRTIQAIPLILGEDYRKDVDYLDAVRMKRNVAEYEIAGAATDHDAQEIRDFAREFQKVVINWLRSHHPELIE